MSPLVIAARRAVSQTIPSLIRALTLTIGIIRLGLWMYGSFETSSDQDVYSSENRLAVAEGELRRDPYIRTELNCIEG
jgi:hypothetical protein